MERLFKVAGIGEILWDVLPKGKQLGGAPCNFAYHALQCDLDAYVISAIGADKDGDEILQVLDDLDLNYSLVQKNNSYPTGRVTVALDEAGIPDYTIHENVAWDHIEQNKNLKAFAKTTDAVCFGSLAQRSPVSMDAIRNFLENTPSDCLKVFDINLRKNFYNREIILKSFEYANVLKLNDDELTVVASFFGYAGNEETILRQILKEFDLKLVAFTKGTKGSVLLTHDEISFSEIKRVEVKDTVGAGDAFTAILVVGMLNKVKLKIIHQAATNVASYVCSEDGATPKLPEELLELIINNQ